MRFVPTLLHGIADYVVGIGVIGLPFLFGLTGTPRFVFVAMGLFVLIYSGATDYEVGLVRHMRVAIHLALDAVFGIAMLRSGSLLEIPSDARWTVWVIGILALILSIITKTAAPRPLSVTARNTP